MLQATRLLSIAHWYAGPRYKHRYMRDKRYHPSVLASQYARNKFSRQKHFKTNRWNYVTAYKDMP